MPDPGKEPKKLLSWWTSRRRAWTSERQAWACKVQVVFEGSLALAVLTLVGLFRYLGLEQPEIGGDAMKVWEFSRQLMFGGGIPETLDHHVARFGLVAPALLGQWVMGTEATTYHWVVLGGAIVLHGLVYWLARLMSGRVGGLLAVCFLLAFPDMQRGSSQLLPELFGPLYVLAALVSLYYYGAATRRPAQRILLTVAGVGLFFAYGAKATFLYFAPGAALLTYWGSRTQLVRTLGEVGGGRFAWLTWVKKWLVQKQLWDACLLASVVIALMFLETVAYLLFTSQSSQLAVIQESHGVSSEATIKEAADFFAMFTEAPGVFPRAFVATAFSALGLLALSRDLRVRAVVGTLLIFLLLQTFVLRQVSPPIPWMRPHPRYLLAVVPLAGVLVGAFLHVAGQAAARRLLSSGRGRLETALGATVACGLLTVVAFAVVDAWPGSSGAKNAMHRTRWVSSSLSSSFERGVPIVSMTAGGKPVRAAGSLYIRPELMLMDGQLPSLSRYRSLAGRNHYLLREVGIVDIDRARLRKEVRRRLATKKCVVRLTQRGRFFKGVSRAEEGCPRLPVVMKEPRR